MLNLIALAATLALAGQARLADETPLPKSEARKAADAIKPLPPVAIPHDPPPHEGAMIDIPPVIEPPDILVVELLEALPGRPITGERLVRPDGKVSLGFYGEVHVRGLTIEQAKVKIIHHLRDFLTADMLGLSRIEVEESKEDPLPGPGTRTPIRILPRKADEAGGRPEPDAGPPQSQPGGSPSDSRTIPPRPSAARTLPNAGLARMAGRRVQEPARPARPPEDGGEKAFLVSIDPAESVRVFVNIASHNSKVYYVQGDVGTPGRLPVTGKETVLDALNYAGGLIPTAKPEDIQLYRPARGGKPAREYKIDLAAIQKGDHKANLQMFPGDRLVVARNATVRRTVEINRAAAPINTIFNAIVQRSFASRSIGSAAEPIGGTTPAQRDAAVKDWADFLWSVSSKEGGALRDEKAFREAVLKRLAPSADEPKK